MANNGVHINLSVSEGSTTTSLVAYVLVVLLLDELDRREVVDKQAIIDRAMHLLEDMTEDSMRDKALMLLRAIQATPDGLSAGEADGE